MKSKKINILYILSFIMLQYYICESLAFVSNGFVESISLVLFLLICLIKIFLRTIDSRDIIYFRRDYE